LKKKKFKKMAGKKYNCSKNGGKKKTFQKKKLDSGGSNRRNLLQKMFNLVANSGGCEPPQNVAEPTLTT
jgi:hypothetical protein